MARVIRSLIELEVTDEGGSPEQESVLTPVPCSGIDYCEHIKTSHGTWLGS